VLLALQDGIFARSSAGPGNASSFSSRFFLSAPGKVIYSAFFPISGV